MPEKRPSSPGPQWGPKKERGSGYASGGVPEEYNTPGYRGSDYPESSPKGFVSPEQIPDSGLNPEEELLAKEAGSESKQGFSSSDLSYVRADGVEKSFEKERQARRNAEEEAGWSPRKGGAKRSGINGSKLVEEGLRVQNKHDKEITLVIKETKGGFARGLGRREKKRTDTHKNVGRETVRAA